MKTRLFLFLFVVLSCLNSTSALFAETTGVDSIYNLLKGVWYKTYQVVGFTGQKIPFYDSDSTAINRISGSDSISFKEYENGVVKKSNNYLIANEYSFIQKRNVWKLGTTYSLRFAENAFSMRIDSYDGSEYGYARTKLVTGITNPTPSTEKMILTQQQATSHFYVTGLSTIDRLEIRDLFGRIQRRLDRTNVDEPIDVSSLSAGVYLVTVFSEKESHSGKIIRK